jgi:nitric oxide reductase activation protein
MKDKIFERKLDELVKEIGSIPSQEREKLIMLARKTQKCRKEIRNSVTSLQESLDYLRVSIKYMIFDLEATRRENAYLRKLLEDKEKK